MIKFREPNDDEIKDIIKYFETDYGFEEAKSFVEEYPVGVVDHYVSDGPGYCGKIIVVIGGEPCIYQILTYNKDGSLEHNEPC